MYEASFGFTTRPFSAFPQSEQYCASESAENALHTIARCIEREEGPTLLIGAAGSGKTLLCNLLATQFQDGMRVATLAGARIGTRRALLQNVLLAMKLPYRGLEEDDLRLQLIEAIQRESTGVLLIVDEAQALPLRLLDELRMLTNISAEGKTHLRLVLAGDTALEERFTSPKLESFNQRIAARCYLQPLNREETKEYACRQIQIVGGEVATVFSDDALDAIYTASHGTPRIINQVCDHTLLLGSLGDVRPLDAASVEEAWADLQQLPAPVRTPQEEDRASIIEFGALDAPDLDDETQSEVEEHHFEVEDQNIEAEEHAAPSLHIAAESLEPSDPERRLDHLEQVVAMVQNDVDLVDEETPGNLAEMIEMLESPEDNDADAFRPAGIVGPETDIIFHGSHHPFDDEFEDEEVVIDQYASLDSPQDPGLVRVTSDESSGIARLLDESITPPVDTSQIGATQNEKSPFNETAAELPEPSVVAFSIDGGPNDLTNASEEEVTMAENEPTQETDAPSPADRVVAETTSPFDANTIETDVAAFVRECSAEIGESAFAEITFDGEVDPVMPEYMGAAEIENKLPRSNQNPTDTADDRDLIVVDDESEPSNPTTPPATVRRMEYRRLFAKLRSG